MRRALVISACGVGFALGGCGAASDVVAPTRGGLTLEEAAAFGEFPLAFAGEHVDGLPLVAIVRRKGTADYMSFVYGDCTPATNDEGCAPPAEVQVWPRTSRPPGRYEVRLPAGPQPEPERTSVHGVPASFLDGRLRLEFFTPRSTIVVFGDSPERVRTVADALRCLPDRGRGPPRSLLDC